MNDRYNRYMRVSCPVAALAAAAALVSLALPSAASAQASLPCRPNVEPGVNPIEARWGALDPSDAVRAALGEAQDAGAQLDPGATWSAGLAPGALDPAAARAALEQQIRAAFGADDAAFLIASMQVTPQPYSTTQLRAISRQLLQQLFTAGIRAFSLSTTCRVTIVLGAPNGEAEKVKAEQIAAPYGDAVRVTLTTVPGPAPIGPGTSAGTPAPTATTPAAVAPTPAASAKRTTVSLWKAVSIASVRRCVRRDVITVRPREGVTLLQVGVDLRETRAKDGKALRVRLRRATTDVAVRATLADGRAATRTLTYRRCSADR